MTLSYPAAVQIETMNFCNSKCVMCPATTMSRVRSTMTDATFNRIVGQILEFPKKPTVTLHGTGEPLLYKKLGERIKALSRHGIKVNLTTNGSILTRLRSFEVIDAGVGSIEFSIETLNKEIFEKIRIGLNLDEVIANLLSCIELRNKLNPDIRIKMTFIAHTDNANDLREYADFCTRHLSDGDSLNIVPRHNFGSSFESNVVASSNPCGFLFDSINIQSDGLVNLCCVDTDPVYVLGDVNKSTIVEIFNGPKYRELRKIHARGERGSMKLCDSCNVPEAIDMVRSYIVDEAGRLCDAPRTPPALRLAS